MKKKRDYKNDTVLTEGYIGRKDSFPRISKAPSIFSQLTELMKPSPKERAMIAKTWLETTHISRWGSKWGGYDPLTPSLREDIKYNNSQIFLSVEFRLRSVNGSVNGDEDFPEHINTVYYVEEDTLRPSSYAFEDIEETCAYLKWAFSFICSLKLSRKERKQLKKYYKDLSKAPKNNSEEPSISLREKMDMLLKKRKKIDVKPPEHINKYLLCPVNKSSLSYIQDAFLLINDIFRTMYKIGIKTPSEVKDTLQKLPQILTFARDIYYTKIGRKVSEGGQYSNNLINADLDYKQMAERWKEYRKSNGCNKSDEKIAVDFLLSEARSVRRIREENPNLFR